MSLICSDVDASIILIWAFKQMAIILTLLCVVFVIFKFQTVKTSSTGKQFRKKKAMKQHSNDALDDDDFAWFTIGLNAQKPVSSSTNKSLGKWISANDVVNINGFTISQ